MEESREQAATLAYSALDEQDRRAAESTLQVFQELFERGGRRAEVAEVSQRRETGGSLMQAGLISLDELTRGVETRMILDGLSPAMAAQMRADVFGFNRSEMVNGVKTAVSRVFGGANPLTAIEETVHGRWRAMKASGRYTDAQGVRWVRMAEEVAGMKFLPEGMADEAVTSEVLDEAIAEVVKADALGRRKSGGMFSPGLISQGMAAFIRGERNLTLGKTKDARALSRTGGDASLFAGFLRGFKELIKTMLEAGRRIQRAREDGTLGEEYDTFLNDLLGADTQQIHEEAAASEAVEIDPDNTPFSMALTEGEPGGLTESEVKPSERMLSEYQKGKAIGERYDDLRHFWRAVSYGDESAPFDSENPTSISHLFWEAGFMGEKIPRWVKAVRIGQIPKDGRSYNFADQSFERGVSALNIVGEDRTDIGTYDLFNDGERVLIEGWLHYKKGADGEPLLLGARLSNPESSPAEGGASFSLASRSLASVAESVISKWATRPEWRDATIRVMRDKLGKLRKDGDWKVSFGRAWQRTGDDSRMAGNRTLASIEAEIPMREALRADELEMEGMETLEQWVMLAFERGAERLKDDRVVSAMLEKGRLISRSEARRQGKITSDGKEAGDYNDAPSLPPSFYSGKKSGYMPDQMAQELFDDGVIPGPLPGDLWVALRESMDNHAKVNEEFKKAKAAVDALKKQARNQAKEETYEWAREQRAKIPTAQQRQMMALRTLDALLSVAPPEVRGKVGGFVKMAGLKTDAAREKEIEARLGKLEQAMERYAKKNYVEQIESLLDRYKPKKDAGGKIKSNTTAEASEDIQYASDFYELSPEKQDEVVAGLESIIATSEDSDQVQEAIGKLGVTHLFHRMKESDSIEAEAALKWIQETVKEGRTSRKALDEARKQWVNVAKAAAVSDATKGKPGGLVDAENADAGIRSKTWSELVDGVKGMVSNVLLTLAHQLEVVFGEDSRITTEFHRRAVFATNEAVDMKREIERRRFAAMTTIFGKGTLNHAKRIGALQRVRKSGVFLTVDSKTQTVDVPAEIVERLLQGIEAKALGLTDKEASQLIDQWADNEALPANKRKRVFSVNRTSGGRDVELKMSEDEAIQYWLWSKQKASMEQMERDGWTEQSFDQLNDFLSDEAKQLAQFFAEEYAALGDKINPVYRRLFNAPFPQAANYSPIFRDVKTTDTIMDMEAQGQSSGLSSGFIMARNKNARAKLRRTSAITAFLQHAENAAHWITHSELIRDMRAVITDTDVQNAIRSTGRTSAANSLKNRIKQLENKGTEQAAGLAELNKWGNRLLQARAFKALAWKISPIMKQTSAFANPLLGDVPAHEYMRGVAKLMAGKLDVKAMWQSDNIQRRIESGFSAEARIAMQRLGYNGSMMLAAMSKGMLPMQLTDAGWTAAGAAIAFDYYREINKKAGMGDAMAESEALKQVEMMIAVTAQPADSVNRSLVEGNSNPWMKSLWMFASESRKTLAVEVMAIRRLTKGLSKNKALDVQRVIVAHVVMGATTQLMSGLLSLLMGDADDKEREWSVEEWAAAIAAGPINGLFVFGDMLEYVGRRLFGLHAFESKTLVGQMAAELAGAPKQIENLLEGDPEEQRAALYKLSAAVGNVLASLIGPNPITAADVIIGNPVKDIDKVIQSVTD
jgi:hypothetical protein